MTSENSGQFPQFRLGASMACGQLVIAEDGQITQVSRALLRWMGYAPDELATPLALSVLLSESDELKARAVIESLRSSATHESSPPIVFETQVIGKHPPSLSVLFSVAALPEGQGVEVAVLNLNGFQGSIRSQIKPAEKMDQGDTSDQMQQLAAIADATPDAIISIDDNQVIVFANPAACRMFQCTNNDMLSSPLERFLPERFRKAHRLHIEKFGNSGVTTREMAGHLAVTGLRNDGSEFPLEASISQIFSGQRHIYTVILRDITVRLSAEKELEFTRTQLRMLTARQRNVRENEQRHISRELHDDIGQRLSALKMDVGFLKNALPENEPGLYDVVENMDELLSTTVAAVRTLASGLRPKILDDLGLIPALETFLLEIEGRFGVKTVLSAHDELTASADESLAVFRIIQEAVHNVAKHSQADLVEIIIQSKDGHLVFSVRDNGTGMRTGSQYKVGALGLLGMRERIASMNGQMQIHSILGEGTTIECNIRLANNAAH